MKDWKSESESGLGDVALLLGWQAPPDDDGFWFREDHGPVHDGDLLGILIDEIKELAALRQQVEELTAENERLRKACWNVANRPCPFDTNHDGDCGQRLCPYCGSAIKKLATRPTTEE